MPRVRGCRVSIGGRSFSDTVYDSVAELCLDCRQWGWREDPRRRTKRITGLEAPVTLLGREGIGVKVLKPDRPGFKFQLSHWLAACLGPTSYSCLQADPINSIILRAIMGSTEMSALSAATRGEEPRSAQEEGCTSPASLYLHHRDAWYL